MSVSNGSYGEAFGRRFGASSAPAFVSSVLKKTEISVTYLHQETPSFAFSEPQPVEDAWLLSMGFRDFPSYSLWEDGRQIATEAVLAPQITMYDLRAKPYIYVNNPLVGLHFNLPQSVFDTLAEHAGVPRIGSLTFPRGSGIDDPVVYHLGTSLMPAFERPDQASRLFVDHVTLAVSTHVAHTYGAMRVAGPKRGGLASWQERRAKEILAANLDGEVSQAEVAEQCGLSTSHFARAFRTSTGMAPHQWLLHRRVETAKGLLRDTDMPLAAVATHCGFADQSHLTRVFAKLAGAPPGAWRRAARN